jgi:hypothetical protein
MRLYPRLWSWDWSQSESSAALLIHRGPQDPSNVASAMTELESTISPREA